MEYKYVQISSTLACASNAAYCYSTFDSLKSQKVASGGDFEKLFQWTADGFPVQKHLDTGVKPVPCNVLPGETVCIFAKVPGLAYELQNHRIDTCGNTWTGDIVSVDAPTSNKSAVEFACRNRGCAHQGWQSGWTDNAGWIF